ncbi:ATP-binding protein [Streptomyces sp. 061-3]|uniref:ATP-binding protein n=1 Tax=Streptomyces sp. 061-3 TaxID=2789268 RepID=UPI003980E64E
MIQHQTRRSLTLDCAGLGIPPGTYALPGYGNIVEFAEGNDDKARDVYKRLGRHFAGEIPLAELNDAEVEFLRGHLRDQIADRLQYCLDHFAARVPRRYAEATPDQRATDWARKVTHAPRDTRSLLLVGPVGTGKTYYGYAALRAVAETGARMMWKSYTAANLFAHLRPRSGIETETEYQAIAKAPLLFLDDLGAAKLTDWTEEVTYRLINDRYEKCLPGIFTSNVPPGEFTNMFGARVASRLTEMCDRIAMKGDDRRKQAGK